MLRGHRYAEGDESVTACGIPLWVSILVERFSDISIADMSTAAASAGGDPLFPSAALLPLSDTGGGQVPLAGVAGPLRPLCATLAVAPIECGKHSTTATHWYEDDPTQKSDDGKVVTDTVKILRTDT